MFTQLKKLRDSILRHDSVLHKWLLSYVTILLIPLLGSVVIFFSTHGMIKQEIIDAHAAALDTFQAVIDSRMEQARQLSTSIMIDMRYSAVMQKSNSPQTIIERQVDLINFLNNYTSAASVDGVLVFVPALDYCVTNNTANRLDRLHRALVYYKNCQISLDAWRDALVLPPGTSRFIYSDLSSYSNFGEPSLIYCSGSITTLSSANYETSLFLSIELDDIMRQVSTRDGVSLHIVDNHGTAVKSYGRDVGDSAMTVPGERYTHLQIGKADYVYMYKRSEASDFAFTMLIPQSIFWQKTSLINTIGIIGLSLVMICGFFVLLVLLKRNYTPVENTMKAIHGLSDKIGKNEFDIIVDKLSDLYQVNAQYQSSISRQQNYLRESYLHQLLSGERRPLADDDMIESLEIDLGHDLIEPVVIYNKNILDQDHTGAGLRGPTIAFVIDNVLRELVDGEFHYYKTSNDERVVCLFTVRAQDLSYFGERIEQCLRHMASFLAEKLQLHLCCIVGPAVTDVSELAGVYQEIHAAYVYQYAGQENSVFVMQQSPTPPDLRQYEQHCDMIYDSAAMKAQHDATSVADKLFADLAKSNVPFRTIKFYLLALVSRLIALAGTGHTRFNECADTLLSCDSLTDLKQGLLRLIDILCADGVSQQKDKISTRVRHFIAQNYADINLSLTQISQEIGLSAKYISKLYLLETGEGLLDYINSVRIQKAKALMRAKQLPISDISQQVGYSNVKTFRRAFHKIEGVNPSAFL
jgi:AraC-like DNA-binding protein